MSMISSPALIRCAAAPFMQISPEPAASSRESVPALLRRWTGKGVLERTARGPPAWHVLKLVRTRSSGWISDELTGRHVVDPQKLDEELKRRSSTSTGPGGSSRANSDPYVSCGPPSLRSYYCPSMICACTEALSPLTRSQRQCLSTQRVRLPRERAALS
jgi:hypothetical protein